MRDTKDEGGRRCPGRRDEAHSAYRKTYSAAARAPEGGISPEETARLNMTNTPNGRNADAARRLHDVHGGAEAAVVALEPRVAQEDEWQAGTGVADMADPKGRAREQAEYDESKAAHDADPDTREFMPVVSAGAGQKKENN